MRLMRCVAAVVALAIGVIPIFGAHGAKISKMRVARDEEAILIEGEIKAGDDRKFINLSLAARNAIVLLSSPGGAIEPALEIGRAIHLKNLPTLVFGDSVCASACALIWVAGSVRLKAPTAKIGFHATYVDENGEATPTAVGNALVGRYLTQLDLPQSAVIFATETPPDEIAWLTDDVAEDVGITFQRFDEPVESSRNKRWAPAPGARSVASSETALTAEERKAFIEAMRSAAGDKKALHATFMTIGIEARFYPVFERNMQLLMSNPDLLNYLADTFANEVGKDRSKLTYEQGRLFGQSIINNAKMNGLARLPDPDILKLFQIMARVTEQSTPAECRRVFTSGSADSPLDLRIIARQGLESFDKYMTLFRDAILAEVHDSPPKPVYGSAENKRLTATSKNLLEAALLKVEERRRRTILQTLDDNKHASDIDYCSTMRFILTTERDIEGEQGTELRRKFVFDLGSDPTPRPSAGRQDPGS